MKYLGDIAEDGTIRGSFNTRQADGTPITLAGSPALAVYKDAATTESTAGVTLTVDFDSRTGHHVFTIDTSADAFYSAGSDYRVVITAGTVDGTSVVGTEVGTFSIENRYMRGTNSASTHDAAAVVTAMQASADDFKADVSSLATSAALATVDSVVDAIKLKTDNLPSDPADASDIAASFSSIASTLSTIAAYIDTEVAAIKAKTDALPADPATETTLATIDGLIDAIKAVTDTLSLAAINAEVDTALADYDAPTKSEMDAAFTEVKGATWSSTTDTLEAIRDRGDSAWVTGGGLDAAGVRSAIGLAAANLDTQLAAIDTVVDTILVDTDELQQNQGDWATADVSGLATSAALAVVDANVDAILVDTGTTIPAQVAGVAANVSAVLVDTGTTIPAQISALETHGDSTWATATGFSTHSAADVVTAMQAVADDFKADVSNLSADVNVIEVGGVAVSGVNDFKADVSGLATSAALAVVDGVADAIKAVTDTLSLSGIADAVWDEEQSGHNTAGTFGAYVDASISGVSSGGVSAGDIANAVWDEARAGHVASGSFGEILDAAISTRLAAASYSAPLNAAGIRSAVGLASADLDTQISTLATSAALAVVDANVDLILADTNELQQNQGDWATATGFSTHSAADVWDVATRTITGGTITTVGDKTGYSISGTITTLDALDTAQDAQHAATQSAISGLNDLSAAEVNAEVDTALADYDAPTKAELDTAQSTIIAAVPTTAEIEAALINEGDGQQLIDAIVNVINSNLDLPAIELAAIASAVRTELSTELGRIDAAISTRLATAGYTAPDNASITAILADTNELQQNQGDWATADVSGLATAAALATVDANVDAILVDTGTTIPAQVDALETHGDSAWATATGFSTHNAADVVTAMQAVADDFKADVSNLSADVNVIEVGGVAVSGVNDFKADVSGLATAAALATVDANVDTILADTNELQANQGNWLTATGFSTHDASDVVAAMQAVAGDFKADVSSLATAAALATVDANVDAILVDTGTTIPAQITALNNLSAADVNNEVFSALEDYDGPTKAELDAGLTALSFSTHTASDVAGLILATPANKLATNGSGQVEASNMRGTDNALLAASYTAPDNASIAAILTDTNELQQNQGDWSTADVSGLATSVELAALETHGDANWSTATGFSTHDADAVVTAMQAAADDFKADVSSLATAAALATVDTVVDSIKAKTDLISTGEINILPQQKGSDLYWYTSESDDAIVFTGDLTGQTIRVVFENRRTERNIAVIEEADMTKSSNSITFAKPSNVTKKPTSQSRDIIWSIRDVNDGNSVIMEGKVIVKQAAI